MDLEIYNSILREGGIDPLGYDSKKKRKYPNGERAFRHDIFRGKTIWLNDKKEDFKLFVWSYHPFLGLFLSPKHHPYTKRKRFITLLNMLCIGSFWASISAVFTFNPNTKLTTALLQKSIVSMCNGTILYLLELCLRHSQSCSCRENTENACHNCMFKCMMKSAVCFWFVFGAFAIYLMIGIVIKYNIIAEFILIFISQFIISWCLAVIGLYLKFLKLWKKDIKIMEKLRKKESTDFELATPSRCNSFQKIRQLSMEKFRNVLRRRKKFKCPYYITYEDSNKWISRHPEYLLKKQMGSKTPLLLISNGTDSTNDGNDGHDDDEEFDDGEHYLIESDLEELSEIDTEETERISPFRFTISMARNGNFNLVEVEEDREEPMA